MHSRMKQIFHHTLHGLACLGKPKTCKTTMKTAARESRGKQFHRHDRKQATMLSNDTSLSIANAAAQKSDYRVMLMHFSGCVRRCHIGAFRQNPGSVLACANDPANPCHHGHCCCLWFAPWRCNRACLSGMPDLPVLRYLPVPSAALPILPVQPPASLPVLSLIALIVGYAADKGWAKSPFKLFGSMLVADVLCFASALSGSASCLSRPNPAPPLVRKSLSMQVSSHIFWPISSRSPSLP